MLVKFLNKIIMATKCYRLLKERCNALETELIAMRETTKQQICEYIARGKDKDAYIDSILKMLSNDKTIARRIIRAINKDDKVLAKRLCNQIIKGE